MNNEQTKPVVVINVTYLLPSVGDSGKISSISTTMSEIGFLNQSDALKFYKKTKSDRFFRMNTKVGYMDLSLIAIEYVDIVKYEKAIEEVKASEVSNDEVNTEVVKEEVEVAIDTEEVVD